MQLSAILFRSSNSVILYFFSYSTNLERYLSVNIRLNHMNRFNLISQRCLTIGSFICSSLISIYTFIHTCIYLYLRVGGGERKGNRQKAKDRNQGNAHCLILTEKEVSMKEPFQEV